MIIHASQRVLGLAFAFGILGWGLILAPISAPAAETSSALTLESVPAEPFADAADETDAEPVPMPLSATGSSATETPMDLQSPPPVTERESPLVSLWNFVTQAFELSGPGDPNHPDRLRLTIATNVGYDDNVLTTKNDPIASGTAGLNGTISYNFGSERLKIASSLALGTTYYDNRPGDSTDYNGTFGGQISYYATRRLLLSGNFSIAYLSQPNPTLIGGVSRFQGDYWAANLGIDISYNIRPRLSARLGFAFNGIQYTDEIINQGSGFYQQTYSLGLDYLVSPRVTLTTEYRYSPLSYYEAGQDSTGHILTVGFITSITPKLKWTLQGGVEARQLQNETQGGSSEYLGPFLETDLAYTFAPNSSLVGTLRYGTEPSGVAGISVRETLRGSLGIAYAFTGRLTGSLSLSYQHDNYDQPGDQNDFAQQYYTASVGLTFRINPAISVNANYTRSAVQSDFEADEYTRGVTTLGLEIIF